MIAVSEDRLSVAYVDTSCLVAIAFGERGARDVANKLQEFDETLSSNLLEAELRSAFHREDVPFDPDLLTWIGWLLPDRPLGPEIARALEAGHLRGADLWHLASALYLAEDPAEIHFLTLDARQAGVADRLGFQTIR